MKKGINVAALGKTDLSKAFVRAREVGFDGIELNVSAGGETAEGMLPADISEEKVNKIRKMADQAKIEIPSLLLGFHWNFPLSSHNEEIRQKGVEWTISSIKLAKLLGAKSLLVIPGVVSDLSPQPKFYPYDRVWELAAKSLRAILPQAEEKEIRLACENVWNRFLLSPREMREFVDQFDSPWVRCYFDVGNVIPFGSPEDWIYSLKERISNVHIKDYRRGVGTIEGFVNLMDGDVNFPGVMKALHEIGYKGYLTAEFGNIPHAPGLREESLSRSLDRILRMI